MVRLLVGLLAWSLLASATNAAEIRVFTAGAFAPVLAALTPAFEQSGDRLIVTKDTVGGLLKRVAAGDGFDVIIVTDAGIAMLTKHGTLTSGRNLASVGIAVGVKTGAPLPDVSTVEAFKRTMLAAPAIAYIDPASGGSSGIYLHALWQRLGIAAEVKPKAVLVFGGLSGERVVAGEASIAVQQTSEIIAVPGLTMVGPLPAEIQNTTVYAGGIAVNSAQKEAATRLLAIFASEVGRATVQRLGLSAMP